MLQLLAFLVLWRYGGATLYLRMSAFISCGPVSSLENVATNPTESLDDSVGRKCRQSRNEILHQCQRLRTAAAVHEG